MEQVEKYVYLIVEADGVLYARSFSTLYNSKEYDKHCSKWVGDTVEQRCMCFALKRVVTKQATVVAKKALDWDSSERSLSDRAKNVKATKNYESMWQAYLVQMDAMLHNKKS